MRGFREDESKAKIEAETIILYVFSFLNYSIYIIFIYAV